MNGSKKIVHFLSASDRINYGDLLFPIIFKKVAVKFNIDLVFKNYGIIKSDFRGFGAIKTASYLNFLKNVKKECGNVVIGGGEVFFAEWSTLYSFISPIYVFLKKNKTFSRVDKKFNLAKFILSLNKVFIPFLPSKSELTDKKCEIFYNTVGGSSIGNILTEKNQKIKKRLLDARYISVRDIRTQKSLNKFETEIILSPDSALIMSDFFSIEFLKTKQKIKKKLPKEYIFLQIGLKKSPENLDDFVCKLIKQASILNLEIILCPIGLAPNHKDDIILKKIEKYSSVFHFYMPKNIFEIMFLIANSRCFLGTSLHGVITAQSFGIPFVPLNKKINKLDSYCKTWSNSFCKGCLDFSEVNLVSDLLNNWNFSLMQSKTKEQKKMVYNNFVSIFDKLI